MDAVLDDFMMPFMIRPRFSCETTGLEMRSGELIGRHY